MKSVDRTVLLLLCGALLLKCAIEPLSGGSGEETTNGRVAGVVVLPNGSFASNTAVCLFLKSFDPVRDSLVPASATTDAFGRFSFSQVPAGDYSLVAIQKGSGLRALTSGIRVRDDTVFLPAKTLRAPGSIIVSLPSAVAGATGYAFIPGTPFFMFRHDSEALVLLDSVPAETVLAVSYTSTENPEPALTRYNVTVSSGDTTVIWNLHWRYTRPLVLNTSSTGANVAGNVMNFPVLIRLNSGSIDFSQVLAVGADIRFTKLDNTFLPYEIERWDPVTELAEVWVRVDTICGNDSSQYIQMFWGRNDVGSMSAAAKVFDTSDGFAGVWHLDEGGNDLALDATANGYNGVAYHMSANAAASGAIGKARVFDGDSSYITMPNTKSSKLNFPEDGNFTVSAWVYADAFDFIYRAIVAKGFEQYWLLLSYFPGNEPLWQFSVFREADNWNMSHTPAVEKQWLLLTGVRQGTSQYLYCNGELVANTSAIYPQGVSRDTSNDLSVGRLLKEATYPAKFGFCYFKGSIDELRISSVAQNSDWIRLCYMNQRSDDRLVQFK